MKQVLCRVTDNQTLWADVQLLTLDAPELARAMRPGQFALARDATTLDPYLRRTLWLYHVEGTRVAFAVSSRDPLAARARVGNTLDLLAPLGHAVDFESHVQHVLLIGEGTRVAPLIAIAHGAIARGRAVVLATTPAPPRPRFAGEGVFPAHLLSPEIEYRTDAGFNAELIAWADAIVASGSTEFYHRIADAVRAARYRLKPGYARGLIDLPMPCGSGVCYACAVETARGVKLACVDGASFDLIDFDNRRTE